MDNGPIRPSGPGFGTCILEPQPTWTLFFFNYMVLIVIYYDIHIYIYDNTADPIMKVIFLIPFFLKLSVLGVRWCDHENEPSRARKRALPFVLPRPDWSTTSD